MVSFSSGDFLKDRGFLECFPQLWADQFGGSTSRRLTDPVSWGGIPATPVQSFEPAACLSPSAEDGRRNSAST